MVFQQKHIGAFHGFGTTEIKSGATGQKNAALCNESIRNWVTQRPKLNKLVAVELGDTGLTMSLNVNGSTPRNQRGERLIKYENIRMVTRLPPCALSYGQTILAISANDAGGLEQQGQGQLSKRSQAKNFKVITHLWSPKDAQTLEDFYERVTVHLTRRKRRPTISSPTQRMSTMTTASWITAYDTTNNQSMNNNGPATHKRRESWTEDTMKLATTTTTISSDSDIFDDVANVNGEQVWSF